MSFENIDLSGVDGSFSGEPIPQGTYTVHLYDIETDKRDSGDPYVRWVFQVAEGEHEGRQVSDFSGLTEKEKWKFAEIYAGVTGTPVEQLDNVSFTEEDREKLLGTKLEVKVVIEEYQGDEDNRIDTSSIRPLETSQEEPVSADSEEEEESGIPF